MMVENDDDDLVDDDDLDGHTESTKWIVLLLVLSA